MIGHVSADLIFWSAFVLCVIAQIAIIRSALVAPMSVPGDDVLPAPRRGVEIAWTAVPAIGLGALLWFTWVAIHARHIVGGAAT